MRRAANKNGNKPEEASDNDTELTQLRPRGIATSVQSYTAESNKPHLSNVVYLEREVMPSDTLQSLALLNGCSVNDIKRANNLITEQDFFALRLVKIPVKRHGLLTEPDEQHRRHLLTTASSSGITATTSISASTHKIPLNTTDNNGDSCTSSDVYHNINNDFDSGDALEDSNLLNSSSESPSHSKDSLIESNDASKFLKKVDKEIRQTVKKHDELETEHNEVLEEVVSSLGSVSYQPLPLPSSRPSEECDGSNWGIKWWTVMMCFVLVMAVIVFVIIKEYIHHEESFSHTNMQNAGKSW